VDQDFVARGVAVNSSGMAQVVAGLESLGLDYIPSYGNFVSFQVGDTARINASLLRQGVIVRPIAGYGMPEHLRVSIGLEQENQRFLDALEKALEESIEIS
jgi:histidinol-phosphate aminotransferase